MTADLFWLNIFCYKNLHFTWRGQQRQLRDAEDCFVNCAKSMINGAENPWEYFYKKTHILVNMMKYEFISKSEFKN